MCGAEELPSARAPALPWRPPGRKIGWQAELFASFWLQLTSKFHSSPGDRMYLVPERWQSRALLCLFAVLVWLAVPSAKAAEKPRLQVDHYDIDAQLIPAKHQLVAQARIK